jgi:Flp pilus assembly protein TadD
MTTVAQAIQFAQSLIRENKLAEAESVCCQILQFSPKHGDAQFLLGVIGMRQNRMDMAVAGFTGCLETKPRLAEAHNNLGIILAREKNHAAAMSYFDAALRIRPTFTEAAINRARLLQEMNLVEQAIEQLEPFIHREPENANLHVEIGYAYMRLGVFEQGLAHYQRACHLQPDHADAHWNLAMCLLALGDYANGWKEYEWRWRCSYFAQYAPAFHHSHWRGESVAGKRVMLHAEQGFGDTIHFVRYAATLRQLGANVLVHCQPKLAKLLASCDGVHAIVPIGQEIPACDYHASVMSLPFILQTTIETIPNSVPYLHTEPARDLVWRSQLHSPSNFKIGIAWQGSGQYQYDNQRSMNLQAFHELAKIPGVQLLSLQKGPGVEQLHSKDLGFMVRDLASQLDQGEHAFIDTASVMKSLDLVISCDTAIGHLAGALGVPVWLALAKVADWRWMLDRSDTPWYPTMRLFRQSQMGDWSCVMREMASEIVKRMDAARLNF